MVTAAYVSFASGYAKQPSENTDSFAALPHRLRLASASVDSESFSKFTVRDHAPTAAAALERATVDAERPEERGARRLVQVDKDDAATARERRRARRRAERRVRARRASGTHSNQQHVFAMVMVSDTQVLELCVWLKANCADGRVQLLHALVTSSRRSADSAASVISDVR